VTKDDSDWSISAEISAPSWKPKVWRPLLADGRAASDEAAERGRRVLQRGDAEKVATIKDLIRNQGAARRSPATAAHHLPRFKGRHRLYQHEGILLGLPHPTDNAAARFQNRLKHFGPDVVEVRPVCLSSRVGRGSVPTVRDC